MKQKSRSYLRPLELEHRHKHAILNPELTEVTPEKAAVNVVIRKKVGVETVRRIQRQIMDDLEDFTSYVPMHDIDRAISVALLNSTLEEFQ